MSLSPSGMKPNSLIVDGKPDTGSAAVNNESPLSEKMKLFRSLFRGREDVFARQWWSQKSQRVGYSPACRTCRQACRYEEICSAGGTV